MKNLTREYQNLSKKHDRMKDWQYLSGLYKQCDEDKKKIEKLQKDNKQLKLDQKKTERKLEKQIKMNVEFLSANQDKNISEIVTTQEVIELENEIKNLKFKVDYAEEKYLQEIEKEKTIKEQLESKNQMIAEQVMEEEKVTKVAKRLYDIDFNDIA